MSKLLKNAIGRPQRVGLVLTGVLAGVVASSAGLASASSPSASSGSSMAGMSMPTTAKAPHGDTLGWFGGDTVVFHYTKNFFCKEPPSSAAKTGCEGGAIGKTAPSQHFDPLYVLVPLGFTPNRNTLQCPDAGNCVDHPHTIDLTRVLGAGTGQALLPPHSHIITDANHWMPEWWDIKVVGVTKQSSWNKIVAGKSGATMRALQRDPDSGVTADIPSNLFLYFGVSPVK